MLTREAFRYLIQVLDFTIAPQSQYFPFSLIDKVNAINIKREIKPKRVYSLFSLCS